MKATIFSDGGSRGNPGEAAIGYVIKLGDDAVFESGQLIGIATNNVAEYTAIIRGVKKAKLLGFDQVEVFVDSQLVERQLKGQYKVKSPELKPLYDELNSEISKLKSFEVSHVRRELNKRADKLVNEALDKNEDVFYEYDLDKLNNELDKLNGDEVKVNTDANLSLSENDGEYVLENLKKLFESAGISNFKLKVLKAAVVVIIKRTELSKLENIVDDVNIWVNNSDFKKIFFEII